MKRRNLIKATALAGSALALGCGPQKEIAKKSIFEENTSLKDKIKHSACRWCYSGIPLEQLCEGAQELGLKSIELLDPKEWDTAINYGLTCAISNGSPLNITKGFNDPQYHDQLYTEYEALIPRAADKGINQIICFSGNRNGMDDKTGLENCAIGLDKIVRIAERYNVKIVMELLNSKVDHIDYMCDHTSWGVTLAEKLGSEGFSLLYDIYHMQIMEGDVIRTIQDNHQYISHYHTGGVPGRHEINETQELNYKAILRSIVDTGYNGFVAQEFIPTRQDPLESLKEGVMICDV